MPERMLIVMLTKTYNTSSQKTNPSSAYRAPVRISFNTNVAQNILDRGEIDAKQQLAKDRKLKKE